MAVNQRGAEAGGDIVGGDKSTNIFVSSPKLTKVEQLKAKLLREMEDGSQCREFIDQLKNYHKRVPDDGVVGLVAKLEASGRASLTIKALEMKEQFAKLLDRWSLYGSAQEIFVHVLAMADYRYSHQILPKIEALPGVLVDELIEEKIIGPAIEEVGADVFSLDHQTAMGMVYWLAEQCRVRWHQ